VIHTYAVIGAALRCPLDLRIAIAPYTPMGLAEQYDVITAHKICFNRFRRPNEWSVAEWRYFVQDALTYVSPRGRLQLELNENTDRYGALRWYSHDLLAFFRAAGRVEENAITVFAP
jgi:hypothetical protein